MALSERKHRILSALQAKRRLARRIAHARREEEARVRRQLLAGDKNGSEPSEPATTSGATW